MKIICQLALCLSLLTLNSCTSDQRAAADFVQAVLTDANARYLYDSALTDLYFRDTSARQTFINECRQFLPEKDILEMLGTARTPQSFRGMVSGNIAIVTPEDMRHINAGKKSEKTITIFSLSYPVFDRSHTFAIIDLQTHMPDPDDADVFYGGGCIYLFKLEYGKWKAVVRKNCVDY